MARRRPLSSNDLPSVERQARQAAYTGLRRLSLTTSSYGGYVPKRRHSITNMDLQTSLEDNVANRPRRPSLTGEDDEADLDFLAELKEQALAPIKEDLADWLAKTLDIDITVDNFLNVLDNGVHVCRLANLIQKKALIAKAKGQYKETVPTSPMLYKTSAQSGSWFARDNTANFIQWCKNLGVKRECLFETEGLVLHKEPRTVVLCLLELARIGAKVGLDPPSLIRLENEIEREEMTNNNNGSVSGSSSSTRSNSQGSVKPKTKSATSAGKTDKLDIEVRKVVGKCNCPSKYNVNKISEGKYVIGGRSMFVRLLKDRHVMVRVGGGWDTLVHYLLTHDPCKISEFKRQISGEESAFLHIRGKYKPS